ncbi:uncharacterized protein LOC130964785 [Arachis stenosperma]|uniref:uncharacterized protein LOC130964785 n=1 Tax=Arachis stenosperma TaxID=217475 RepID=UPI0025AC6FAA|nr:uncharacterized protein LOC130964785 [Arachis stenosperma]
MRDLMRFKGDQNLQVPFGDTHVEDLKQFANWILQVENEKSEGTSDGCSMIKIPHEFLITDYNNLIQGIVQAIYSDYIANMANESHLKGRAILVPTIYVVDELNDYMTALNNNECKMYVSSNKCVFEGGVNAIEAMHTPRFLATISQGF